MKIYTKTGDKGTTAVWGGKNVPKHAAQVEAYGTVDELTSMLGVVLTHEVDVSDRKLLTDTQRDLYALMSTLCDADVDLEAAAGRLEAMESRIDQIEKEKPTPAQFILVQGSPASVWLHVARTLCRRAERRVVKFTHENKGHIEPEKATILLQYLNRLSDLLFALARMYNKEKELLI